MEITTTMVRFSFSAEAMRKKTNKAQLFLCGSKDKIEKVWVPLNKLEVRDDEQDNNNKIVVMPKWLYLKSILPFFSEPEEFIVTTEVHPI